MRGFERNELGPVVYVVSQGGGRQRGGPGPARSDTDSVQVSATGGNALAIGNVELRVPSPVFG